MFKICGLLCTIMLMCLSLHSCYEIDDNRRVQITGRIIDKTGNNIENILVESRGNGVLLGSGFSDVDGNFKFTSLESNARDFSIYLNAIPAGDSTYTSIAYVNTPETTTTQRAQNIREVNLYDLGTVTLKNTAYLDLEIRRDANIRDTLYFSLKTPEAHCEQFYTNSQLDAGRARCFQQITSTGTLESTEQSLQRRFHTIQGDTATFNYRLNSQSLQEVKIPINSYNTRYVFEF